MAEILRRLVDDGHCVIPGLLTRAEVAAYRERAERCIAGSPAAIGAGSAVLIDSDRAPWLAPLIGHRGALAALAGAGIDEVRAWKGVLIAKAPGAPRMPWHQDCLMWRDPRAYSQRTPMLFLMWYLQDTHRGNGCLRIIPGSHRGRHPLHDAGTAHDQGFYEADDDDPRLADQPGEIEVPIRAGDLLVGDGRMFHATHANLGDEWRSVVTVWWHPWWPGLDPRTRAMLGGWCRELHAGWPSEVRAELGELWPTDEGEHEGWYERAPMADPLPSA
jgi:hypothetical protein